MRRSSIPLLGLTALVLAPVACEAQGTTDEKVIRPAEPIQGGTVDQGDTNVVGILINSGGALALLRLAHRAQPRALGAPLRREPQQHAVRRQRLRLHVRRPAPSW